MKTKVLIIDDDRKLCELLVGYLARFDMEAVAVNHPDEGLSFLRQKSPDIIILDVMLPSRDGFEVCKEIRKDHQTPILMLTARGDITDRVVGLEIGADDYLSKPFEPRELVARITSVLRRTEPRQEKKRLRAGELEIDLLKREAKVKGVGVELTTMEFDLLAFFLERPGVAVTRDEILERMRGIDWEAFNRSVDVSVSRLRQKLKDPAKHPTYFKTIWGTGYMFIAKVERI